MIIEVTFESRGGRKKVHPEKWPRVLKKEERLALSHLEASLRSI